MSHQVEKTWMTRVGLRACCLWVHSTHRCGYVAVPKEHPLYRVGYDEESAALQPMVERMKKEPIGKRGIIPVFLAAMTGGLKPTPELVFNVHGSLTYAGGNGEYPIPGDDLWWFGFDCAHAGDMNLSFTELGGEMRTLNYVIAECESLAEQLVELEMVSIKEAQA